MPVVYFAHSYRDEDSDVVGFFLQLMERESLVASLDPPSNELNLAKPQRHLRSSDGLVAILTRREDTVSPYILFEVALAKKASKPMLVFVEDVVPDRALSQSVLPPRILQRRFNRRRLLRETREHRHALRILKTYIGEDPVPRYQPFTGQRNCLVLGPGASRRDLDEAMTETLHTNEYRPVVLSTDEPTHFFDVPPAEALVNADLAVCLLGLESSAAYYVRGAVEGAFIPLIQLTTDSSLQIDTRFPAEYQPRILPSAEPATLKSVLAAEIRIFEQDYLEIDEPEKISRYSDQLLREGTPATYRDDTRLRIEEVVMGDRVEGGKYERFQAAAVGPGAHAENMALSQTWNEMKDDVDLQALSSELTKLREELRNRGSSVDQDKAIAEVAQAEEAAQRGEGPTLLGHLKAAGKWVLDIAKTIGVPIATKVIERALGLP